MDNIAEQIDANAIPPTRLQKFRQWRWQFIFQLKWKATIAFWTILNFLGLNRPYSKLTCKLGIYRKFPDGRCMYCGEVKP